MAKRPLNLKGYLFSCIIIVASFGAHGASTSTSTKTVEKKPLPLNFSFDSSVTTNREETDSPDRIMESDISASTSLKFDNGVRASLGISANKNLIGERKMTLNDGVFTLSKSLGKLGDSINVGGRASLSLPLSEASRENRYLITKLRIGPSFSTTLKGAGLENVSVSYAPSASFYFNEYETALSGASNTQYLIANTLSIGVSFLEKFSVSISGSYYRKWTYQGTERDSYSMGQTLSYSATDSIGLYAGHSIGGSPLAPNGRDEEIKFFDERDSVFYAGFSLSF